MVLVFKTSLQTRQDCRRLAPFLDQQSAIERWTVDLDDCDRVLRVVTPDLSVGCIIRVVQAQGFFCAELDN